MSTADPPPMPPPPPAGSRTTLSESPRRARSGAEEEQGQQQAMRARAGAGGPGGGGPRGSSERDAAAAMVSLHDSSGPGPVGAHHKRHHHRDPQPEEPQHQHQKQLDQQQQHPAGAHRSAGSQYALAAAGQAAGQGRGRVATVATTAGAGAAATGAGPARKRPRTKRPGEDRQPAPLPPLRAGDAMGSSGEDEEDSDEDIMDSSDGSGEEEDVNEMEGGTSAGGQHHLHPTTAGAGPPHFLQQHQQHQHQNVMQPMAAEELAHKLLEQRLQSPLILALSGSGGGSANATPTISPDHTPPLSPSSSALALGAPGLAMGFPPEQLPPAGSGIDTSSAAAAAAAPDSTAPTAAAGPTRRPFIRPASLRLHDDGEGGLTVAATTLAGFPALYSPSAHALRPPPLPPHVVALQQAAAAKRAKGKGGGKPERGLAQVDEAGEEDDEDEEERPGQELGHPGLRPVTTAAAAVAQEEDEDEDDMEGIAARMPGGYRPPAHAGPTGVLFQALAHPHAHGHSLPRAPPSPQAQHQLGPITMSPSGVNPAAIFWAGRGGCGTPTGTSSNPYPLTSALLHATAQSGPAGGMMVIDLGVMRELVTALRYEDPKLPSPRMGLLLSSFRAAKQLRLPMLQALTQACYERLVDQRQVMVEMLVLERDLQAPMNRDHGVGLAELLSTLLTFIREEMGLRSPASSDEEEEEDEEEDDELDFDDEDEDEDDVVEAPPPPSAPFALPIPSGEAAAAGAAGAPTTTVPAGLQLKLPGFPLEPPEVRVHQQGAAAAMEADAATQATAAASSPSSASSSSSLGGFSSASCAAAAAGWGESMVLIREALQCLGIFLRAHARKMPSAALDRAEMDHLRDAVGEVIAAYPPAALKITDLVLRAWPFGQSTREVGFLQLLGSVLASAPLLHHIDDRTRLPLRAFARVSACLCSPHAGVAEEALITCSNPRLISLYVGVNAPGAGPKGTEVPAMVKGALAQNAQGHWNGDVREESGRLLNMLAAAEAAAAAAVAAAVGPRGRGAVGKGLKGGRIKASSGGGGAAGLGPLMV